MIGAARKRDLGKRWGGSAGSLGAGSELAPELDSGMSLRYADMGLPQESLS